MARLRESLIIDEINFFEEPLGGNSFLTMKNMMYGLIAVLVGYKLIDSGKPVTELLGILLIAFLGFLIAYPKKSVGPESLLIGLMSYYLFGSSSSSKSKEELKQKKEELKRKKEEEKRRKMEEKLKKKEEMKKKKEEKSKKKEEKQQKSASQAQKYIRTEEKQQIIQSKSPAVSYADYIIIIIGIAVGAFGAILFHKELLILNIKEMIITMVMMIAGFSVSFERILEILIR
ncbi:hypothetical protein [Acidianus manzaensis]|uniref:Uncharacterized protein n=1 Tax=Acidianus manzaensis TaxID=282676 RepID=A0A1W6K0W3_9CREN|nr:hypothetical protein [Acidianus manzaensis]ARM76135.1 hypothetical protein B6F84_08965 [Acidianus manzaensis]